MLIKSIFSPFRGSGSISKLLQSRLRPVKFLSTASHERERLEYDVVVVGAGPAGLSAAIQLRQLCERADKDLSVCVLEKGSEVGAHILSGNIFEPRAMDELLPKWRDMNAPLGIAAAEDEFFYLTKTAAFRLPTPPQMNNHGNYVISLSEMVRWLGEKAEDLGVEIYPGFAAANLMYSNDGAVCGVTTNDFGIAKDGSRKENYEPGMDIAAKVTLLAEGCRGSLTKQAIARYQLDQHSMHQTYALGLKEVWRIPKDMHSPGKVVHTIGYPLDMKTYGGSFLYHMNDEKLAIGYVVALDYHNPYLSPYQEFQRFKAHPKVRSLLEAGEVLQYGARTLNEGGLQSIPRLEFPGGALIGCSAGFLNVPKIKGTHTAQKSGMIAADIIFKNSSEAVISTSGYQDAMKNSWVWKELEAVRNIRPGFKHGLLGGLANAALETYITRGKSPWTLSHSKPDHEATQPLSKHKPIGYPKPDGQVTFDILTAVSLSGTNHDHDEPCHLVLEKEDVPEKLNLPEFGGPESRYCPARVYEYVEDGEEQKLQINAQNCLHCKACDIKDPTQNINWTVPQGGGGPKYTMT
ncbi:unnamed protein product [Agarophyton chilense]|eukprot:gb/GEZJ01002189.1/.p2 GENE.gb/GEZJ01002189.1/~~gb/GEZJ01002189.1/.p2  ORF type:complete len:576 (+),score=75.59 gb/GEZJ01002189.1/:331-2058(+)